MGKFDGVLLCSDFDDTFSSGGVIHPDNLTMLEYFEAQGGRFTIASGRAMRTFGPLAHLCPMNAPAVLGNGAQFYDFSTQTMLQDAPLPPSILPHMEELAAADPTLSIGVYRWDEVYIFHPNRHSQYHLTRAGADPWERPLGDIPFPWHKVILMHDHEVLLPHQRDILARWGDRYEAIFSNDIALELNAKGCTKGRRVLDLADLLGIEHKNVYCVGDNENDLSMLEVSAIPFAPDNSIPLVKAFPGVHILPRCEDGAIAELVRVLDAIY